MPAGVFVLNNCEFKPAILIPVYNHELAITHTLEQVLAYGFDVLLVDDGSDKACQLVLENLALQYQPQVSLLRLHKNGGKGHAVKAGLFKLNEQHYSHALQVDADGQHNLADIPLFISTGLQHSRSLICGYPQYDHSVSKGRYYSRYLTHIWVWINTLSFTIKDSMCGFRLYPLQKTTQMIMLEPCGNRMDFDSEVIVRWVWRGGEIENIHTKVHYPTDGVSHFKLMHDNMLISWMHTRLFFGMLRRLPVLIWRKF